MNCPLCQNNNPKKFKIYFDTDIKAYQCLSCNLVSQYPGPGEAKDPDYYSRGFRNGSEWMFPERNNVLTNIADNIFYIKSNPVILDVGCGDGHFLSICQNRGWETYGIEPSRELAEYADKKVGNIKQGFYDKNDYPEKYFDVISMIQVLEHIANPCSFLETAKYHLKTNGIVVIEVPSIYAPHVLLYSKLTKYFHAKNPSGVGPDHVNYFSPHSLEMICKKAGLKPIKIITGRWKYKYSGLLGKVSIILDPLLNAAKLGGILLIAVNF